MTSGGVDGVNEAAVGWLARGPVPRRTMASTVAFHEMEEVDRAAQE